MITIKQLLSLDIIKAGQHVEGGVNPQDPSLGVEEERGVLVVVMVAGGYGQTHTGRHPQFCLDTASSRSHQMNVTLPFTGSKYCVCPLLRENKAKQLYQSTEGGGESGEGGGTGFRTTQERNSISTLF